VSADYSQLQLRIFAHITEEQEMIDAFVHGWDAHDFVARKIFNVPDSEKPTKSQRRIAKNVNFGFIFGASPKKIEKTAGIPGLWDTVLELFPNAHAFIEETKDLINHTGIVNTMGDYPLQLKMQTNQWSGAVEPAAHAGVNYIVQGSEGVIVKRAMRLCDDYLSSEFPEGRIVLQIHDELVFEMPKRFPKKHAFELAKCMEQAASELGLHAPVEPELIVSRWDKSVPIIPF
jgi:DNA polymerase-1